MRICIDLDGVICTLRGKDETYDNLLPVDGAIEKIRKLKENGHYIIIYTARRMKTHGANTGRVVAEIGKITLDWLEKYDIPYDEIYFGKPWANLYIDDNAFRFENWDEINENGSSFPTNREKALRGDE